MAARGKAKAAQSTEAAKKKQKAARARLSLLKSKSSVTNKAAGHGTTAPRRKKKTRTT